MCNGIGTKPVRDWEAEDIERFVDDTRGLWDSIQLLERWVREIVRRNCARVGLDAQPTVSLSTYLEVIHHDGVAKPDAFAQMLDWWAEQ